MREGNKTKKTQLKAAAKYISQFESATIRFPAGTKKRIATLGHSSVNAFTVTAVMEKLDREESYRKGKTNE